MLDYDHRHTVALHSRSHTTMLSTLTAAWGPHSKVNKMVANADQQGTRCAKHLHPSSAHQADVAYIIFMSCPLVTGQVVKHLAVVGAHMSLDIFWGFAANNLLADVQGRRMLVVG